MSDLTSSTEQGLWRSDLWLDQLATMRAWEDFLTFQDPERSRRAGVRREILESWSRSLASGINALLTLAPLAEDQTAVPGERDRIATLREVAKLPFARIAPLLSDSQAILILTDHQGMVLDQIGDTRTYHAAERIHLSTGGNWSEATMGTNAIGTTLRLGIPTVVHASEHFCQGIKTWTCAAAPVWDPVDQSIIAVVDLSGPPEIFRPHNLALAQTVAREIEVGLVERQERQRRGLLEAFLSVGPGYGKGDTVVILDQLGRVMYHRPPHVAEASPFVAEFAPGQRLMQLSDVMSENDIERELPKHLHASAISKLMLDGVFGGAALILPKCQQEKTSEAVPSSPRKPSPLQAPLRIAPRVGAAGDELLVIGDSPAFQAAVELANRAAGTGTSVLIQGETGTGKEIFARLIHAAGAAGNTKNKRPFVTLNCGAVSSDLFGSELFGHVAGAFTGASREGKAGKFEQADGGVLCLDEIGEMPRDLQPYLLRVLEQRAVYRIGCSRRRQLDVQLVAMTNRNLEAEVELGSFRRDLYYRIGTLTIDVPALRHRGEDILRLAHHFNAQVAERLSRERLVFATDVEAHLLAYAWPGNVRELRNLIERLHVTSRDGKISLADLPLRMGSAAEVLADVPSPLPPADAVSLSDLEARAIRQMLTTEEGNLTRVAAALGISRPTLYRKLKAYGIRRHFE